MSAIAPTTTDMTAISVCGLHDKGRGYTLKDAAPMSSPIARLNVPPFNAENVEKTSGLPFPKAKKVTPAVDSFKPRYAAIVARLGQKKSEADIPMKENRKARMRRYPVRMNGRVACVAESYQSLYGRSCVDTVSCWSV